MHKNKKIIPKQSLSSFSLLLSLSSILSYYLSPLLSLSLISDRQLDRVGRKMYKWRKKEVDRLRERVSSNSKKLNK